MQNIDNKVFRNLPEQVLWNKEQIESWIENGGVAEIVELTPDPNVFMGDISQDVIDRISGKPLVFVFCGQDVYVKFSESTAVIAFLGIRVNKENHSDHIDIKTYQLNILKLQKKWNRSRSMLFETYSKAQLDVILQTLKNNSFQDVNTTTYPTLNDFLASTGEEGYIYLYPVNILDLSKGYMMYIWKNSAWRYMGTTALDLSNYFTKDETLALLADKSSKYVGAYVGDETKFSSDMAVGDIIMESTGGQLLIKEIEFVSDVLSKVVLVGLEDNGNPVVHKYESGAWSTSNYVDSAIAPLSAGTFNTIKVSEMTSNINFSASQVAIINNGKPTIIEGTLNNQLGNVIILRCFDNGTNLNCLVSYVNGSANAGLSYFLITKSNGYLNIRYNFIRFGSNSIYLATDSGGQNNVYINGKKLPEYPSDTTKKYMLVQQV